MKTKRLFFEKRQTIRATMEITDDFVTLKAPYYQDCRVANYQYQEQDAIKACINMFEKENNIKLQSI